MTSGTLWVPLKPKTSLSPRELELCRLVAADLPDKEIALEMKWKVPTVRTYLSTLFRRVGVGSRTGLAMWCLENRLISFNELKLIQHKS